MVKAVVRLLSPVAGVAVVTYAAGRVLHVNATTAGFTRHRSDGSSP